MNPKIIIVDGEKIDITAISDEKLVELHQKVKQNESKYKRKIKSYEEKYKFLQNKDE